MLQEVTMREMEAVFAITDRLGISREALVVPLVPRTPGRVRGMPNGRIEIVADASDFPGFVERLEDALRAAGLVPLP